jgi:hypothetical protein
VAALRRAGATAAPLFCALVFCALVLAVCVCRAQQQPPPTTGRALSVGEYAERVERVAVALDSLWMLERETAVLGREEDWARPEAAEALPGVRVSAVGEARSLLPPVLRVARGEGGAQVEVDNRWLHSELTRYERQPPTLEGERERVSILSSVVGRLRALAARLAEGGPRPGRDKEAEKGRLAAILRGADFNERGPRGQSAAEQLLERFLQWVQDLFPRWSPVEGGAAGSSPVAQYAVFALVAVALVFVLWRYLRWRAGRPKPERRGRREARVVLGERLEDDQTAADILEDAERLARAGNLRGAIRKAYVALLCEMGDRHLIRLAQHKTNRDYLRSVRDAAPQTYGLFRPLTDSFERHWYGLAEATERDWNDFRAGCRRALGAD